MAGTDLGGFEKVLRAGEGRRVKRLAQQAAYITTLEPEFQKLSDDELRGKTAEFRQRLENGEPLEDLLFEAFAAVREARLRESDQRMFDVQLMGGIVLHEGDIAEMKTGEGKTFVASAPLYLNALPGTGVHLVTVNDYLAKRDAEWNRGVFERLGMTVGAIENMLPFAERKAAYDCDVTYGTNSEFGFDYLRDNMAVSLEQCVQRGHAFAIVDEVDSILVDEARTPLIISGEPETAAEVYVDFARVAKHAAGVPAAEGAARRRRGRGPDPGGDRLPLRREVQDGRGARGRDREGRARAAAREPLRRAERPARQPPEPGAEGAGALPARRRLRRPGRRGEDRRRVHRPHHGRAPLVGGPAPGGRGEGGRADPGGARHPRDDHAPELLPPLREARRHDRYREDRGEGVRRDLRHARRRDPDQRAGRPRRQERLHLQDGRGQVLGGRRGHQGAPREGAARPRRHDRGRDLRVHLRAAEPRGDPAQRAEREGARARGGDHQGRGPAGRGHDRDEHGRPRRRHQARRGRGRARRAVRARHRAPRGAPHRQPAPRPLRPPGRPGRDTLLPLGAGRPRAPVRRRPDLPDHRALQDPGRPADGGEDPLEADRERAEEGRGAELRLAQERPQVRRRDEQAARRDLRPAPQGARGRGLLRGAAELDRRGGRARGRSVRRPGVGRHRPRHARPGDAGDLRHRHHRRRAARGRDHRAAAR